MTTQGYPNDIRLIVLAFSLLAAAVASAFSLDTYAPASALSSGRWVKIKVSTSGVHLISNADLQRWGFSDPAKVRVYGYGGAPISDILSQENYVDDLPLALSEVTSRGIVFYAHSTINQVESSGVMDYERNYYSNDAY